MEIKNVFRIRQWGYGEGADKITLYIVPLRAEELLTKLEFSRRSPDNPQGYQRQISKTRLGQSKYGISGWLLHQGGIFPTSVLVNIRTDEDFKVAFDKPPSSKITDGTLTIPDEAKWYVLDGQHRLSGLIKAIEENEELKDYPVIVTLTNENSIYEMLTFYIVNNRAKSVPTDLAYRILQKMHKGSSIPGWVRKVILTGTDLQKARAANVVDLLNEDSTSPFYQKIKLVGMERTPEHYTSDQTMIRYVAILLAQRNFSSVEEKDIASLLIDYWSVIQDLYPECFDNHYEYLLLSTLGISSMIRLLPTIHTYAAKDGVSKTTLSKYLRYLQVQTAKHDEIPYRRPILSKWWHRVHGEQTILTGTGEGHYTRVARHLAIKIELVVEKEK